MTHDQAEARRGLWYGLGAYGLWGCIPLYFRLLRHLAPLDVLAHRVWWSFILLLVIVAALGRLRDLRQTWRSPRAMGFLTATAALIAINWFTYIYAVSSEQLIQASLGYFITPLANVALGVIVLNERLRRLQVVALVLATAAVIYLGRSVGEVPWIALSLAASFSLYGLLRKLAHVEALLGLLIETTLLVPLALGYIVYHYCQGTPGKSFDWLTYGLLALAGAVTTGPLLLFAAAVRRLTMTTLGFLQYLAPTLQFVVAVLLFGEKFTQAHQYAFAAIWAAVALYTLDSLRARMPQSQGEAK